ncbi:MAG: metallophosphoesterase [Chlorobia bacterium]|nr:metallophosphoesterase [Fimbriimonadaceae bacterium]
MTRREFLVGTSSAFLSLQLPMRPSQGRTVRAAVVTDVHHGLAPDAQVRFDAFLSATKQRRNLDLAIQMGDFCHPGEASQTFVKGWRDLDLPQLNVLGNHDMDRGTKRHIMDHWGMKEPFGSYDFGDFRFIILDLNHYRKGKELNSYAYGNYFASGITHNWADPEQLQWFQRELSRGEKPTILLSHQPLGFGTPGNPLPPEQEEVFEAILSARRSNPKGAVVACLCGHMHVDRLEKVHGIPCLCINSASYFWSGGMHAYREPLFAFLEFNPSGELRVFGRRGQFVKEPPAVEVAGKSASISDYRLRLSRLGGW